MFWPQRPLILLSTLPIKITKFPYSPLSLRISLTMSSTHPIPPCCVTYLWCFGSTLPGPPEAKYLKRGLALTSRRRDRRRNVRRRWDSTWKSRLRCHLQFQKWRFRWWSSGHEKVARTLLPWTCAQRRRAREPVYDRSRHGSRHKGAPKFLWLCLMW